MTDPTDDTPDLARAVEALLDERGRYLYANDGTSDTYVTVQAVRAVLAAHRPDRATQPTEAGMCPMHSTHPMARAVRANRRLLGEDPQPCDCARTQPTEAALMLADVMEAIREARVQHEWPAETDDGLDYQRCSCGYRPPYSPGGHADPLVMADHCDGAQAHAVLLLAARTQPTAEPRTVAPGGFSESYALAPEPRTVETDERGGES